MFLYAILVGWPSMMIFLFLLFYILHLFSRLTFCGYRGVCIKYLIDKIVLFLLLIASYPHLPIVSIFFLFPFYIFVVSDLLGWLCSSFYSMNNLAPLLMTFSKYRKTKTDNQNTLSSKSYHSDLKEK